MFWYPNRRPVLPVVALLGASLLATHEPVQAQASSAASAAPAAPAAPVASFFRLPLVSQAVVSPSGRYVAMALKNEGAQHRGLVVLDMQDLTQSRGLASFADADVADVHWVNEDRLTFSATESTEAQARRRPSGLFAINRDGKDPLKRLISRRWEQFSTGTNIKQRELTPEYHFLRTVRDGSNDVLVERVLWNGAQDPTGAILYRLDTVTQQLRSISQNTPENAMWWATDLTGAPKAVVTAKGGKNALYWASGEPATWTLIKEFDRFGGRSPAPMPLQMTPFGMLAEGLANPSDEVSSLLRITVEQGQVRSEPLLTLKGYDFDGSLEIGARGELLGVKYLSDARATHWFDPTLTGLQKKVDELMPSTVNLLDCGQCAQPRHVLVQSFSDRQPSIYLLYNVEKNTLEPITQSMPWIDPRQMAQRDMVRIKARDGLELPVHITRPRGAKGPTPMVVLVHGGPWVRGGEWAWDSESQFLASRGYTVIEPEFRGSTGYGSRLYSAGFKQWGLAMQDDLVDAAQWAVKQGHADPQRICIAGASYGGYATLMGLIRNPEIFRCGVQWVGVTDIDLMYSISWSDSSEDWKGYGMPVLVGDRVKDAKQLAETSPIRQAARLKQPLLMAYGGLDRRVPLEHGKQMRDALAHNSGVEWIVYADEGHGWYSEKNRVDFWTRVDAFLDKHLKSAP